MIISFFIVASFGMFFTAPYIHINDKVAIIWVASLIVFIGTSVVMAP